MKSNESAENYLETILILSKKKPVVRSVDIADELGFKKSSVSVAMKNLREKNHITVTPEGYIYLTESGQKIADMIYERHEFLSSWLISVLIRKLQPPMHAVSSMSSVQRALPLSRSISLLVNKLYALRFCIAFSYNYRSSLTAVRSNHKDLYSR